jgi:hypothetical protein
VDALREFLRGKFDAVRCRHLNLLFSTYGYGA